MIKTYMKDVDKSIKVALVAKNPMYLVK